MDCFCEDFDSINYEDFDCIVKVDCFFPNVDPSIFMLSLEDFFCELFFLDSILSSLYDSYFQALLLFSGFKSSNGSLFVTLFFTLFSFSYLAFALGRLGGIFHLGEPLLFCLFLGVLTLCISFLLQLTFPLSPFFFVFEDVNGVFDLNCLRLKPVPGFLCF